MAARIDSAQSKPGKKSRGAIQTRTPLASSARLTVSAATLSLFE